MRSAVVQRLGALALITFGTIQYAERARARDQITVADVNVRYHLLPGVRLNSKSLESSNPRANAESAGKNNARPNLQPPVPQPVRKGQNPTDVVRSNGSAIPSASLSLARNLKQTASWEALCQDPVRVSFFGDYWVPPHSQAANLKKSLFDGMKPLLNWGDFNIVNFEGSITQSKTRAFPKYPFALKQAPESVQWLTSVGVKHFTRANNHSMDFGWQGAQETSVAMSKAGAQYAGVGADIKSALKPMILEKNGTKVAVFSVTTTYPAEAWAGLKRPGVAHPSTSAIREAIEKARKDMDFIVVAFHWGEELKPTIKSHQEEYAKIVLKAGADLVVGHHAHLAQKIDSESNDGVIVYGVGNFIFSSLSRDAKFGLGAHVEFCRSDVADAEGTTHQYRLVLSPLTTFNRATGYKSRPMTLTEFLPFAREYVKKGYFSGNLEFYIPSEDQVQTLQQWLQPRSQASKEGRAVN